MSWELSWPLGCFFSLSHLGLNQEKRSITVNSLALMFEGFPKALRGPCSPMQHMTWLFSGRGDGVWSTAAAFSDHHVLMLLSEEIISWFLCSCFEFR